MKNTYGTTNWSEGWSHYKGKIHPDDKVVTNVRQESAAGWFIGALQIYNADECECYSRDSEYYPTERICEINHPGSKSIEEAFAYMKRFRKI